MNSDNITIPKLIGGFILLFFMIPATILTMVNAGVGFLVMKTINALSQWLGSDLVPYIDYFQSSHVSWPITVLVIFITAFFIWRWGK